MLTPETMREINLFVFEDDLEAVIETIARLGALHLEDVKPEVWQPAEDWAALAGNYQRLAGRLERLFTTLGLPLREAVGGSLKPSEDLTKLEAAVTQLEERVASWKEQLVRVEEETERLQLACAQLELLEPLELPVEALRETREVRLTVGVMPSENLSRVGEALFRIPFLLIPLEKRGDRTLLLAAATSEHADILQRALASAFFEETPPPIEGRGVPHIALQTLREQLREAQRQLAELQQRGRQLADELEGELQESWRGVQGNLRLTEAMRRFPHHGGIYLVSGWVPERQLATLRRKAEGAAKHPLMIEVLIPSPKRRSVPTLLRTPAWLQPFELLLTTFGLPAYDELDPLLPAALIFLPMYGMMFGDLGHGLLLTLIGLWLWRRGATLGVAVTAAGGSGALFGLLYGTAFGVKILPPLWLRPLESITSLLIAAVIGGVAILNLGFVLNLISTWRARRWPHYFLDKNGLLGLFFYWALLGGGLLTLRGQLAPGLWLIAILPLGLLLWWREPLAARLWGDRSPPLGEILVTGFFELFEAVIGYASNSLSFVRLGAFAVAHEGLARMVLRYAEGPAGWLVFLLGTLLIVGFEGMIVGIQALRLEYYEFFGRFFRGTGQPFVPLSDRGG